MVTQWLKLIADRSQVPRPAFSMSSRYSRFSSLPPGVLGDVCGEVILTVSDVIWTNGVDHPCCVCAKWWGEPGDGVLLWPAVTSEHGSTPAPDPEATTATYAVASGPEQLARYMSDMRVLVLDVFSAATDSPSRPPLGHAYLHLGLAHFETEFRERLAVYDAADAEVGKLDVSLVVRFAAAVGAQSLTAPEAAEWVGKTPWLACGAAAGGASLSTASSFALNEKLAIFDPSLPLLPEDDRTVLPDHPRWRADADADTADADPDADATDAADADLDAADGGGGSVLAEGAVFHTPIPGPLRSLSPRRSHESRRRRARHTVGDIDLRAAPPLPSALLARQGGGAASGGASIRGRATNGRAASAPYETGRAARSRARLGAAPESLDDGLTQQMDSSTAAGQRGFERRW